METVCRNQVNVRGRINMERLPQSCPRIHTHTHIQCVKDRVTDDGETLVCILDVLVMIEYVTLSSGPHFPPRGSFSVKRGSLSLLTVTSLWHLVHFITRGADNVIKFKFSKAFSGNSALNDRVSTSIRPLSTIQWPLPTLKLLSWSGELITGLTLFGREHAFDSVPHLCSSQTKRESV